MPKPSLTVKIVPKLRKTNRYKNGLKTLKKDYELYLFLVPAFVFFLVFKYWPLYGLQIAFKDYNAVLGFTGSPWVGLKHINNFASSYYFWVLIKNTFSITIYALALGFPAPIIFALMLNEVGNQRFKKLIQTATYAPHFISTVVVVGMLVTFLSPSSGIINHIIVLLGGEAKPYMILSGWFRTLYVFSGVWQETGWSAIIYIAALSAVNIELYESAFLDGANRLQKIINIDIPSILPTIIIIFILRMGSLMNVGFEKVFLMQNPLNMETSDVISTYVYRRGLLYAEFSFSSAIGLFNSVINFILLIITNVFSKLLGRESLW